MTIPRPPRLTARDHHALVTLARLRYLTIPLAVAHLGLSADGAYRLLRRLAREGFIRTVRWNPRDRLGPPSVVAVLTAKGAQVVAEEGGLDPASLHRVLKSTAARARDVAAGFITTLAHDLDVLVLHAVLERASPEIGQPHWGVALRAPFTTDPTRLTSPERNRLTVHPGGIVTYVPDATSLVETGGTPGVLFLELETGKARTPELIGVVKAAKMHAVWRQLLRAPDIPGLGTIDPEAIRFVVWCPTTRFRDGFLAGARRVLDGRALPLVAVAGDDLPLRPPAGLLKASVPAWITEVAAKAGGDVWHGISGLAGHHLHDHDASAGRQNAPGRVRPPEGLPWDPFGPTPLISA